MSASYLNYQLPSIGPKLFVGLSTNALFEFVTEPENEAYAGSILVGTSKVFDIVGRPIFWLQGGALVDTNCWRPDRLPRRYLQVWIIYARQRII